MLEQDTSLDRTHGYKRHGGDITRNNKSRRLYFMT